MDMFVTIFFTIGFITVFVLIVWSILEYVNKRNDEKRKRQRDYDKINEELERTATLLEEIKAILKTR